MVAPETEDQEIRLFETVTSGALSFSELLSYHTAKRVEERRKEKRKKPLSAFLLLASLNEFKREFLKMLNSDSTLQLFHEIDSLIQSLLFYGRN